MGVFHDKLLEMKVQSFSLILTTSLSMGGAFNIGETKRVPVTNGAETDSTLIGPEDTPVKLVWGHGLGSKDPELRTRFNDVASNITFSAMEQAGLRCVCYDARGHGSSHGWEDTSEKDRLQFSWSHLSRDMLKIAEDYGLEPTVLGGSSMGSASALYAAIQDPSKLSGLILMRPPTAWEERLARKPQLIEAARKLREAKPESLYYNVLLGSAVSDLPPHQALENIILKTINYTSYPKYRFSTSRF